MLELYYFENSICSERALMTLAEKSVTDWVPHHVHLFERQQFDPEYLKLNPKAQVPTLVHDGEIIRESSLIAVSLPLLLIIWMTFTLNHL